MPLTARHVNPENACRAAGNGMAAEELLEIERREPTMLVLSRNKGQEIVIGEDISIVILEVRGERVRVGIDAPAEIPVHRREVKDAIDKAESASTPT